MHLVPDVFAVANAVLYEGNLVTSDHIQVGLVLAGYLMHVRSCFAQVAALP